MSFDARFLLGIALILSAVGFFMIGTTLGPELPAGKWPFFGLALLCSIAMAACFWKSSRPVTLRVIGAVNFVTFAASGVRAWARGNLQDAIVGFVVWGLPAGYVAFVGRYPKWGHAAAAFTDDSDTDTARSVTGSHIEFAAREVSTNESTTLESREWVQARAARTWGLGMSACGLIGLGLPFIGFEFRQLGRMGTWSVSAVLLAFGVIALAASISPNLTNLVRLSVKSLLGCIVLALALLLVAIPVMIVYFLVH